MRARTRCAAILGIALVAPIVPARGAEVDCPGGFSAVTEIELFFGRDIEKRGMVTERQFHDFVGKTVTPALPDGFTLTDAQGQYRYADGRIVLEQTKILSLNATPSVALDRAIDGIIDAYKRRFDQEKVLEERRGICAKLE